MRPNLFIYFFILSLTLFSNKLLSQDSRFEHEVNEEYFGFKINYGYRPIFREKSIIEIGIDSAYNKFGTYIYDQYNLGSISSMRGLSLGVEYGINNAFLEGVFDAAIKDKTNMIGASAFAGYNITFMYNKPVAIRPALGLHYTWLWTDLGSFPSSDTSHHAISITQSNALFGIKPRVQIEVPIVKFKDTGFMYIRVEAGYQLSAYTSRFIKLKAERTYENDKGKVKSDSERFYLDSEYSGYYINGEHANKPPTTLKGIFYSIEVAFKIINF